MFHAPLLEVMHSQLRLASRGFPPSYTDTLPPAELAVYDKISTPVQDEGSEYGDQEI